MHWTYSVPRPSLTGMTDEYHVSAFITELRAAATRKHDDAAMLAAVRPALLRLARSDSWRSPQLYECDASQGFGVTVLHEEPDRSLWLVAVSWLPGRGAQPHNHGTWAVVAGVDGEENNILWLRRGGWLERQGEETIGPGSAVGFLPQAIHSVKNEGPRRTLSLHVYGKNLNCVERSQFDPATGLEQPFKLRLQ